MVELLAWMIVLLLAGPPLVIFAGGLLLLGAALLPNTPNRVRETFRCPWTGRVVTADFLVPEGAAHPSEVTSCTAFGNPARVTCNKACRGIADVRWGMPRWLFPRWALTAGGPVGWRVPA